jgi:predicted RNase H-like nuclease
MSITFIGFDSAWTDNKRFPGAICSIRHDGQRFHDFKAPVLVSFNSALEYVRAAQEKDGPTLVAIDQPTIVPNPKGMRPAERVAASVVSWLGGGVQPANRSKVGMFDDGAPIWGFLRELGAIDDPLRARAAEDGLFIMEVFPALALAAFHQGFCGRLKGPRYNPARRKTFCQADWDSVVAVIKAEASKFRCTDANNWSASLQGSGRPGKSDQDKLDAVVCLLSAIRWRLLPPDQSIMIGDRTTGYIVAPVVPEIRRRLASRANLLSVLVDGKMPSVEVEVSLHGSRHIEPLKNGGTR